MFTVTRFFVLLCKLNPSLLPPSSLLRPSPPQNERRTDLRMRAVGVSGLVGLVFTARLDAVGC